MYLDSTRNLARVIAPLLVLWSTPALAQWETAHGYALKTGERCPAPHDRDPAVRRTDGRAFDIPAGFKGEIEIYGHGVDLIHDANVSGETFASYGRGVGGAENGLRGCGAIGSIVVRLDVKNDQQAGTHTLRFGDQNMRVRIVKPSILRTVWSPQTLQGGSTVRGNAPGGPAAPPPAPRPPVTVGPSNCNPNVEICRGVAAGGSGGNTFTSPDAPPVLDAGIGACLDDIGGNSLLQPTTLTLTLPIARTDTTCLTRPIYFNVEMGDVSDDFGGFRAGAQNQWKVDRGRIVDPPRYSGTLTGFTGPAALADPNRDFQSLRMTSELARTFVGERRILLNPGSGSGNASQLTLILRSDPGNGIRDVQGVPVAGGRPSSNFEVRFDFLAATTGRESVFWRLRALGAAQPTTCFAATSGNVTGNSGGVGRFTLTATEAAACNNARFALDLAPERNGAGFFDRVPYSKTVEFALQVRGAPTLTPGSVQLPR